MVARNFITVPGEAFNASGAGAVERTVDDKLRDVVSVKDFGAVGDGITDDTSKIQAAIDSLSSGGVVYFPPGQYRIARNIGVNDRWGLKVTQSNIILRGDQATLRRFNTDISTYTLAYPILFIGTPDSDVAAATENVVIENLRFVGENTQHAISGSAPSDFRDAIHVKNTKNLCVRSNTFSAIDSAVIFFQKPVSFDYANSQSYNTTKSYNAQFVNNTCIATSHAVTGRALIHAVVALGIDNLLVDGNYFEWCDDGVISDSTYDLETTESNTFTTNAAGWTLGAVRRSGRGVIVSNNNFYNSSEHAIYLGGFEEVVASNKVTSDQLTITSTNDAIKIRSYGCAVTGNYVSEYGAGISCAAGALNVSISGNTIYIPSTTNIGIGGIGVNSTGLSSYVAGRITAGYWTTYRPMSGIVFTGNSIQFPTSAHSPANTRRQMAFVVISDTSDANYPQGQIQGLCITGNNVDNYQVGVQISGTLYRNLSISGNSFFGKPFTEAGFSSGTTVDTRAVIQTLRDSTDQLRHVVFTGNTVYGVSFLVASFDAGGSVGTLQLPWGLSNNTLNFVKNIATADFVGVAVTTKFNGNTGIFFLDRTWGGTGINNSLYSGDGSTGNQALRYNFLYSTGASQMRFYTDDAGSFVALN